MNLSAPKEGRKWPYCRSFGRRAATVTATILLMLGPPSAAARHAQPRIRGQVIAEKVPLPRPRPAEAPHKEEQGSKKASEQRAAPDEPAAEAEKPAEPAPPPVSACRRALTEEIAIAPSIPDIHGPGGCGGEDLVRLEAIVLPDQRRVAVTPPATLRCPMATAIADWVRSDVVDIAKSLGSEPAGLDNFDSYECRGRNRVAGAQLSEHGRANALDVRAIKLADGKSITLTDRDVPRDLRERVLHSVCARFSTVLGPDSDWYHEEHIHLDLIERRNNYRICQWDVLDPLPKIAPLLPAARPDEAPPRKAPPEDKADDAKPSAEAPPAPAATDTASPEADTGGEDGAKTAPPASSATAKSAKSARRKRKSDAR